MCVWDFRQLSMAHGTAAAQLVKMQIDQQPCLKAAVSGAPHSRLAAISTYQGERPGGGASTGSLGGAAWGGGVRASHGNGERAGAGAG